MLFVCLELSENALTTVACDTFDAFRYATEDLSMDISRTASYSSIWLNLIPRGVYPKNVGTFRSVFSIGNVEPTNDDGIWTPIDLSNQLGTAGDSTDTPLEVCTPDWTDVEWGFFEGTYGPERKQLRGPVVCKKDLEFSHDPDDFLRGYVEEISKYSQREWELNLERHHVRLSRKAIAVTDFEDTLEDGDQEGVNGLACADCELTEEMLEMIAERLYEDGATTPDSNGFITWEPNGFIWTLYIGMRQSMRILRQNSELRQDYRDAFSSAGEASPVIKRLGSSKVVGNFRHVINQRPRRYSCVGGTYTQIPRYIDASGGDQPVKGSAQIINPAWREAPYEGADVLSPDLFTSEIVQPVNSAGGLNYPAGNYMGDWKFITGAYKWAAESGSCDDPLEEQGRHFGQLAHAPKPKLSARFKYGYHIIYRRCFGSQVECTSCSSS